MTNLEIVIRDAIAAQIFTKEQVDGYLSEGDLPLKTFREWLNTGFVIKRGEKARLKTRTWQPCKKKKDSDKSEKFILVPTYLFTADQVIPLSE